MADQNIRYLLQTFCRLQCLQREGTFCDLVLMSKDGAEFKVHTTVLAAASKSFYTLLVQKGSLKKVRLMNINSASLGMLIRFIYGERFSSADELKTLSQALKTLGMKDLFNFIGLSISEELDLCDDIDTVVVSSANVQCGNTTNNKTNVVESSTDKQSIVANRIEGDRTVSSKGGNTDSAAGSENSVNSIYFPTCVKSEPKTPEQWEDDTDGTLINSGVKSEIHNGKHKNSGNHDNQTCVRLQQLEEASGCSESVVDETESVGQRDTDNSALQASYQQQILQSNNLRPVGLYKNDSLSSNSSGPVLEKDNTGKKDTIDNCDKSVHSFHHPHPQQSSNKRQPVTIHPKVSVNPVVSLEKNIDITIESTVTDCRIHPQPSITTKPGGVVGEAVDMNTRTGSTHLVRKKKIDKYVKRCRVTCKRVQVQLRPVDNRGNYALFPATSEPANDYLGKVNVQSHSSNKIELPPQESLTSGNISEITTKNGDAKDGVSGDHSGVNQRQLQQEQPSCTAQTPASSVATSLQPTNVQPLCSVAATQNIVITPSGQMIAFPVQHPSAVPTTAPAVAFPKSFFKKFKQANTVHKLSRGKCILPQRKDSLHLRSPMRYEKSQKSHVSSEPVQDCVSKRMKMVVTSVTVENENSSRATGESMSHEPVKTTTVQKEYIANEDVRKPDNVEKSEVVEKAGERCCSKNAKLKNCSRTRGSVPPCDSVKPTAVPMDNEGVKKSEKVAKTMKRSSSTTTRLEKYSSKQLLREDSELTDDVGDDSNEFLIIDIDSSESMGDDFSCVEWPSTDSEKMDEDGVDKPITDIEVPKSDMKLRSASQDGQDGLSLANPKLDSTTKSNLLSFVNLRMKAKFHAKELDFFHDKPELCNRGRKKKKKVSEESSHISPPTTNIKSTNAIDSKNGHEKTSLKKITTVKHRRLIKKTSPVIPRSRPVLRPRTSVTDKTFLASTAPSGVPSQASPASLTNSLWVQMPGGGVQRVVVGSDDLYKASIVSSAVAIQQSAGAIQPSLCATQPSAVTIRPSTGAIRPSAITMQPSAVAIQQSAGVIQPSAGTTRSSAVPIRPSTCAIQPSAIAMQPSLVVQPTAIPMRPSTSAIRPRTIAIKPKVPKPSSQVVMQLSAVSPITRYVSPTGLSGNPVVSGLPAGQPQTLIPNYVVNRPADQPIRMTEVMGYKYV